MNFEEKYNSFVDTINKALDKYVVEKQTPERKIYNAMKYSLMAGGKRLRPVLSLAVTELLNGNIKEVLPFACAIEMIHTYSLIHDDLPCMDNDDYRRGRLTNHKVFGESLAVLAGDALLNYAFEIMLESCMKQKEGSSDCAHNYKSSIPLDLKVNAMGIIANAAGVSGMIGGQVVDIESEGKKISKDLLMYMHRCKTGALIKSCVVSAAVLSNAGKEELKCLEKYAENIGLAFQIKDDILDVEGDSKVLGKPTGSDQVNEKSTFVSLYGMNQSKRMLVDITSNAINSLEIFREKADFLKKLADYLIERQK